MPAESGTYLDQVLGILAAGGDREVMVYRGRRISCRQAHETILRAGNALRQLGLGRGQAVAIQVTNRPESVLLSFAVHLIGCRLVFVPHHLGLGRLVAFVNKAEPDAFIFDPELGDEATELARQVSSPVVLSLGEAEVGEDLLTLTGAAAASQPELAVTPDDISTLMYSGGTTGLPKLAIHGHNIYAALAAGAADFRAILPDPPRTLLCSLTTHTSGCVASLMTLLAGGTLVLADSSFDAGDVIRLINAEQVNFLFLISTMLYEILDHPACPREGFPSLKRIFYGGAPIGPDRLLSAIDRFGPVLRQGYGLAEVPSVTALEPDEHDRTRPERLGSCGRPAPGTQLEVRGSDGRALATRVVGDVYVRSPMVTRGYWRDQEQTDEQIHDGWLRTGDVGYLDEDGYLYLVDRSKDVIVPGANPEIVYSRLLDDFFMGLPGVRQAAAVGSPDRGCGEAVHVFLVREPGADLDVDRLRELAVQALGRPYWPESFTFVEALPLTPIGKIDKKALRGRLGGADGCGLGGTAAD